MVRRSPTTIVAKETALQLFQEGKKLHEVMDVLMGKFGFPYQTAYSLAREVQAFMSVRENVV